MWGNIIVEVCESSSFYCSYYFQWNRKWSYWGWSRRGWKFEEQEENIKYLSRRVEVHMNKNRKMQGSTKDLLEICFHKQKWDQSSWMSTFFNNIQMLRYRNGEPQIIRFNWVWNFFFFQITWTNGKDMILCGYAKVWLKWWTMY